MQHISSLSAHLQGLFRGREELCKANKTPWTKLCFRSHVPFVFVIVWRALRVQSGWSLEYFVCASRKFLRYIRRWWGQSDHLLSTESSAWLTRSARWRVSRHSDEYLMRHHKQRCWAMTIQLSQFRPRSEILGTTKWTTVTRLLSWTKVQNATSCILYVSLMGSKRQFAIASAASIFDWNGAKSVVSEL